MTKETRILICDDSAFMRMVIKDILDSQKGLAVVGQARDGMEAVEKATQLNPDVITMDVEMPKLNGLEAMKIITKKMATRVIMVSSLTEEGAEITIEALENGAVDFLTKPSGSISTNFRKMGGELVSKINSAMLVEPSKVSLLRKTRVLRKPTRRIFTSTGKIVLIASSTGGPKALDNVIPLLPRNLPAPVIVVQHMPAGFTKSLAARLDKISDIEVCEAGEGDILKNSKVYVAPGNFHLGLKNEGPVVKVFLDKGSKINGVRPAADFTFDRGAEIYKKNVIGVVLTGMGRDGTKGCFKIKHYSGKVIAEAESTCVVYGMPKSVVKEGYSDFELPSHKIAEKIVELV
ncbi:MAG: protein-glutamate methylesterase/protein-glutamine glutaminase [Thermotogota bacterium]